ncbi:MAG: winged helix-turn-helix domain-containing protein [Pseudolabrys sp.]|nr:winged helix-turn-helix domain-containing protein [Pseudolabrys sp.]
MFRFAGFELDLRRAELRGPDGGVVKLRPKTFEMLRLFAANAGRVVSKQELMQAVWPNVYVGEDSLFQCIREIRTALGDDKRQLLKVISGRGYLFDAEVTTEQDSAAAPVDEPSSETAAPTPPIPATYRMPFGLRAPAALAIVAVLGTIVGLAFASPIFGPGLAVKRAPTVVVMPFTDASGDQHGAGMAAGVTDGLIEGLARIANIRVVTRPLSANSTQTAATRPDGADFVVQGELGKSGTSWTLQARLIRPDGEVAQAVSHTVNPRDMDAPLQRSRLVAGVGHPMAVRLNAILESGARPPANGTNASLSGAKAAIEQATASINQTTRERFAASQTMLEQALAAEPDSIDIAVALAALKLRGIQMVWYSPEDSAKAESTAKAALERALKARPNHIPVLEAYCRFLNATNHFIESLVACARTLSFDPWNGLALYHIGLAKIQLGRFEEALETFKEADRYDTPQVSRWTWLLGAGWANLMLKRGADAVPWIERSIAITPATGRSHYLLAAAYQLSGRPDEAKAAMAKGNALRPGTNAVNIRTPTKNVSPVALAVGEEIVRTLVAIGLPER